MRVIHLNYSDINGGAARAAYRIHHCLRDADIDSFMWVNIATAGDWTVRGPASTAEKLLAELSRKVAGSLRRMLKTGNPNIHSLALLPSQWVKLINATDADIIHLHWVAAEMLSVSDICRISKPLVWTLHDMWAFCGAEHYACDDRWRTGYRHDNRPPHETGFDLNRWTWARKRRKWQRPIQIVSPSRWLADCVRESVLMRDWPVAVVPNALDTESWRPIDQRLARGLLGLPLDGSLVLFSAHGGGRAQRKGFDLLHAALGYLRGQVEGLHLLVFGQLAPKEPPDLGFSTHYFGHMQDDLGLRALYSAADVLVIPSRQDNLPNTGVEALACGTPVVAFNTCGLPDIVDHLHTGYLARALDPEDMAQGILWVLRENAVARCASADDASAGFTGVNVPMDRGQLSINARRRAVERFSYPVVAAQYVEVYKQVLIRNAERRLG